MWHVVWIALTLIAGVAYYVWDSRNTVVSEWIDQRIADKNARPNHDRSQLK